MDRDGVADRRAVRVEGETLSELSQEVMGRQPSHSNGWSRSMQAIGDFGVHRLRI